MRPSPGSDWFETRSAHPAHRTDLVFFPPAGGGTGSFRHYRPETLDSRLLIAALPGRGARFREPPVSEVEPLLERLAAELTPLVGASFALFGHSLGAIVAFEVARRLPTPPTALFVAGANAPRERRRRRRDRASLSDAEFVEELSAIGGTPKAVLENEELLSFMMPALRADFTLVDTYTFVDGPPLACPIHVLGADADDSTSPEGLGAWADHTSVGVETTMFPGGHFFVQESPTAVQTHVRRVMGAHAQGRERYTHH